MSVGEYDVPRGVGRVAIMTIAYNEEDFIGAVVRNWKGKVHKHCVFLSSKPWHGQELPKDKTEEIAKSHGAEVVSMHWPSETAQRNYALGYLRDYDYVLIVDADELYTEADTFKILDTLGTTGGEWRVDNINCYRIGTMKSYFKTTDYILDPPDTHKPNVAIDPKKTTFRDCRIPSQDLEILVPDVVMHHVSYLRNDLRLYHKMKQFEHYNQVSNEWFNEVWKKWHPDSENVRAYGREISKAVQDPMPEEIKKLLFEGYYDLEQARLH